jgi:hypothetical protein
MLRLLHRVVVGDRHQDVVDHHLALQLLVYLIYKEKLRRANFLDAVQNLNHQMRDVAHQDERQNLGEQNLDAIPPFLGVVHQFLVNQLVVAADAELRHLLKMDCYRDVVGVEPRHQLKMDCYLDVVPELLVSVHFLQHDRQLHALQPLLYLQSP